MEGVPGPHQGARRTHATAEDGQRPLCLFPDSRRRPLGMGLRIAGVLVLAQVDEARLGTLVPRLLDGGGFARNVRAEIQMDTHEIEQLLLDEGEVGWNEGVDPGQTKGPALQGQGHGHVPRGGLHHTVDFLGPTRVKRMLEHLKGRGPFQIQGGAEVHQLGEDPHPLFSGERIQGRGQEHQRCGRVLAWIEEVQERHEHVLRGFVLLGTLHVDSSGLGE